MKKYLALIMKSSDFGWGLDEGDTVEDILGQGYIDKETWVTGYTFSCPDKTPEELVVRIGHGYFWENGWSLEDTVSCMMEDFGEEALLADSEDLPEPESEESEADPEDTEDEDEDAIIIKATIS